MSQLNQNIAFIAHSYMIYDKWYIEYLIYDIWEVIYHECNIYNIWIIVFTGDTWWSHRISYEIGCCFKLLCWINLVGDLFATVGGVIYYTLWRNVEKLSLLKTCKEQCQKKFPKENHQKKFPKDNRQNCIPSIISIYMLGLNTKQHKIWTQPIIYNNGFKHVSF